MGQARNIWVGSGAIAIGNDSLLTRLLRSTSRWRLAPARPVSRGRRDYDPDAPAPRRLHASRDLPAPNEQVAPAAPACRPYLVLVEREEPMPSWASFSAAMPAPLTDDEVAELAATMSPRAPRLAAPRDGACERVAARLDEDAQQALTQALERLRALTIQARH